jgi:hypothetical protein
VKAASLSLGVSLNGDIGVAREIDNVTLRLGDSGTLVGRIVRATRRSASGRH